MSLCKRLGSNESGQGADVTPRFHNIHFCIPNPRRAHTQHPDVALQPFSIRHDEFLLPRVFVFGVPGLDRARGRFIFCEWVEEEGSDDGCGCGGDGWWGIAVHCDASSAFVSLEWKGGEGRRTAHP